MKKYIELQSGDITKPGDEWFVGGEWEEIPLLHMNVASITAEVRRPATFEGKTAFLVNYSPLIRVVIDTTGLSEEEIDSKLIEAAKARHCYEHQQYMNDFGDNIDWENTKEDTECPHVDPEPKNPGKYRMLEIGESCKPGDEMESYGNWIPVNEYHTSSDDPYIINPLSGKFRRPITNEPQYRPFKEGDVIEDGDQVSIKGDWDSFDPSCYGEVINPQFVPTSRKLIK